MNEHMTDFDGSKLATGDLNSTRTTFVSSFQIIHEFEMELNAAIDQDWNLNYTLEPVVICYQLL